MVLDQETEFEERINEGNTTKHVVCLDRGGGGLGGMSVPSISHSSSGYDTIQSPSRRGVKTTTRRGDMTKLPLLLWHKITTEKIKKTHHV